MTNQILLGLTEDPVEPSSDIQRTASKIIETISEAMLDAYNIGLNDSNYETAEQINGFTRSKIMEYIDGEYRIAELILNELQNGMRVEDFDEMFGTTPQALRQLQQVDQSETNKLARQLLIRVEGELSKELLNQIITYNRPKVRYQGQASLEDENKIKQYLSHWINTKNQVDLQRLTYAVTSKYAVNPKDKFEVVVYKPDDSGSLPEAHSCFNALWFKSIPASQEEFDRKMSQLLDEAEHGYSLE